MSATAEVLKLWKRLGTLMEACLHINVNMDEPLNWAWERIRVPQKGSCLSLYLNIESHDYCTPTGQ